MVLAGEGAGDLRAEAKAIQKAIRDANFEQDEMRRKRDTAPAQANVGLPRYSKRGGKPGA